MAVKAGHTINGESILLLMRNVPRAVENETVSNAKRL